MNTFNIASNLWIVKDCFDPDKVIWLNDIKTNMDNRFSVSRPHMRLLLDDGDDQQRLQKLGLDLLPELEKITDLKLNFMASKFWLDLPGFACQIHHDAVDIVVTLQVYINYDGETVGAEFLHVRPSVQIPIETNCGYINLNTDLKYHRVQPQNGTRTSVVFHYTLSTDS